MRLKPGVIPPGLSELLARSYQSYGVIRSYPRVDGVIHMGIHVLRGYWSY